MRTELIYSDPGVYRHSPNDTELEPYYRRGNILDHPKYEFLSTHNGKGFFQVKPQEEKTVFGPKHMLASQELSRGDYVKLKYQGNGNIVGRKKNQVQTAIDHDRNTQEKLAKRNERDPIIEEQLAEVLGNFKDKVAIFDIRRLQTLRSYLLKVAVVYRSNAQVLHILGEGVPGRLVIDFIRNGGDRLDVERLDRLLLKFEE